jgi:hypothetical protein
MRITKRVIFIMARRAKAKVAPAKEAAPKPVLNELYDVRQEHKTFSHVMYFLFLISITVAAYFTFQAFAVLGAMAQSQSFYTITAILMLLWGFLFWEFGHRIHQ